MISIQERLKMLQSDFEHFDLSYKELQDVAKYISENVLNEEVRDNLLRDVELQFETLKNELSQSVMNEEFLYL